MHRSLSSGIRHLAATREAGKVHLYCMCSKQQDAGLGPEQLTLAKSHSICRNILTLVTSTYKCRTDKFEISQSGLEQVNLTKHQGTY